MKEHKLYSSFAEIVEADGVDYPSFRQGVWAGFALGILLATLTTITIIRIY